jgi:hypothetical protein
MEKGDLPIPEEFLCPITHELMKDPVLTMDGQTYEREAISNWFQRRTAGNVSSPITGAILPSNLLLPNYALKSAINKFNEHLPFLTNALNEIHDIQKKLSDKEKEIREHIKHGLAIVSVINTSDLVNKCQSTMQALAEVSPSSNEETKDQTKKNNLTATLGSPTQNEEESDKKMKNIIPQLDQQIDYQELLKQVTFTTPQEYESYDVSLINSLILHQQTSHETQSQSLLKEIKYCEIKQNEVKEGIKLYEKESLRIENLVSDLKARVKIHEQGIEILKSKQLIHQKSLDELCQRYCEMAHLLQGESEEISKKKLLEMKISPPTEAPKSPILQDYLKVVGLMNEGEVTIHSHLQQIEEYDVLGHKEQFRNVMLKLEELCLTRAQLESLHGSLNEQFTLCSDQLKQMNEMREELLLSIQWARRETIGFYQVNLLTLPLILLLYKQQQQLQR